MRDDTIVELLNVSLSPSLQLCTICLVRLTEKLRIVWNTVEEYEMRHINNRLLWMISTFDMARLK